MERTRFTTSVAFGIFEKKVFLVPFWFCYFCKKLLFHEKVAEKKITAQKESRKNKTE